MKFIPAIDIKDKKCVRLEKGKEESAKVFNNNPLEQAKFFEKNGCERIHIVDLDSAFGRPNINKDLILKIRNDTNLLIELGGGRKQVNDNINYQVGFDNVIGIGDSVDASTPITQVHAESKDDFERTKNQIIKCFTLSDRKVSPLQPINERIS